MADEIIARDKIAGTVYEYRIGPSGSEGKEFAHQIQLRSAGSDRWDTALMGNFGSREAALNTFISRYSNRDGFATLEAVHPTIKKNLAARVQSEAATARQAEKGKESREEAEQERKKRRVDIDKGFAQASFKKASAPRTGPSGVALTPAVGPSFGGLIVHENGLTGRNKGYNITHAQSGLAIGGDFATQTQAKIAVWRVTQMINFDQSAEGVQADTKASGVSFGAVLRRLADDQYSALDDVEQVAQPPRQKAKELKESQEKRKKETLARTPTGKELLATSPARLGEVFAFPTGKAMPRTRSESNRLIEATINAAAEADNVALSDSHPSINVVKSLEGRMTNNEFASYIKLLPDDVIPFHEKTRRKVEQKSKADTKELLAKLGPDGLNEPGSPGAIATRTQSANVLPRITHAQGVREKAQAGSLKPRVFNVQELSAREFKSQVDKSGEHARPGDTLRAPNGDEFIITDITDKDVVQFTTAPTPGSTKPLRAQFGSFKAPLAPHLKGSKARLGADRRARFGTGLAKPQAAEEARVARLASQSALMDRRALPTVAERVAAARKAHHENQKREREATRMKQHAKVAARPAVKAIAGVSTVRAKARFEDPNAGRAKGKGPRRPERDLLNTSKEVAPSVAINAREERLQKRWFKNPGKLDFQGVDTKGARKPKFKKDQRKKSTARAGRV